MPPYTTLGETATIVCNMSSSTITLPPEQDASLDLPEPDSTKIIQDKAKQIQV